MRLNSIHNALFAAAKLLRAELIAIKLIPAANVDWSPADIAVGETSQLQQFDWSDGGEHPRPQGCVAQTQSLFGVADALTIYSKPTTNSLAMAVSISETMLNAMPGQFLHHERRGSAKFSLGTLWVALTLDDESPYANTLFRADGANELVELILGVCSQTVWGMYRSAMLAVDRVTGLPGPAELNHRLQLSLASLATQNGESDQNEAESNSGKDNRILLILFEIDNFSLLRRQLEASHADALLKELAASFRQNIRKIDGLFRVSDSKFAIAADINKSSERHVLEKVTSTWRSVASRSLLQGVSYSIGYYLAGSTDSDKEPAGNALQNAQACLINAEQALAIAHESPGYAIVESTPEMQLDVVGHGKQTDGFFTNDPIKDHRNNRLLWQVTSLIAGETNQAALCRSFIDLLQEALNLRQADIFTINDGELCSQTGGLIESLSFNDQQHANKCIAQRTVQQFSETDDPTRMITAIPLVSRSHALGVLMIETGDSIAEVDLLFLKAIADQIAGALDRIELALRQELLTATESASLRAEIQNLKAQAPNSSETIDTPLLVAVSQPMRDVLAYVEKVAPTDASVLIMGESGAGKEVMAKAIVAASDRRDAPLITVDCSAIAHSLIDSELFGRVKGAFTGADAASPGRVAEADGGTLFLDEIGELPLDVQAKLLRFVQEKELIAVGDTHRRRIDTRIICATNRDLLYESSQGRFRSDLYYRLQVLQVTVPPLRERQADIAPLADSFLQRYSKQFGKSISGFTDTAWQKIQQYNWPGNVRELQNAIVRATLTAETDLIDASDLQFGEELPTPEQTMLVDPADSIQNSEIDNSHQEGNHWNTLTSLLAGQVAALVAESRLEAPVGRWLADTVVLTAATVSDGVARQAARLLGVPETTLRRQLNKARQNEDNPFQLMSRQWLTSLPALTDLLKILMSQDNHDIEFAEYCQALLLQQVANHIGDDRKAGAALMGITPPTYARWLERHAIEPKPVTQPATTTTFKLEQKYS